MNDLVNMKIMWYVSGNQWGPARQMEVMIKDMVQMAHENGRKR
jgi:hypothetical protein